MLLRLHVGARHDARAMPRTAPIVREVVDYSFGTTMRGRQRILTPLADATDSTSVRGPMYTRARSR
jgi:hypothetical protein